MGRILLMFAEKKLLLKDLFKMNEHKTWFLSLDSNAVPILKNLGGKLH